MRSETEGIEVWEARRQDKLKGYSFKHIVRVEAYDKAMDEKCEDMTFRVMKMPNGAMKKFWEPSIKLLPGESPTRFNKRYRRAQKDIYENNTVEAKLDVSRI